MTTLLPDDAIAFLREPQHAVLGWVSRNGRPITAATWYDWDNGEILLNMDATRKRLASLQVGSLVSLTVLDVGNWYRHVSLLGRIARIAPDLDLGGIDRLARRYTGADYRSRDPRVSAWMAIDSWHGWVEGRPWPGLPQA